MPAKKPRRPKNRAGQKTVPAKKPCRPKNRADQKTAPAKTAPTKKPCRPKPRWPKNRADQKTGESYLEINLENVLGCTFGTCVNHLHRFNFKWMFSPPGGGASAFPGYVFVFAPTRRGYSFQMNLKRSGLKYLPWYNSLPKKNDVSVRPSVRSFVRSLQSVSPHVFRGVVSSRTLPVLISLLFFMIFFIKSTSSCLVSTSRRLMYASSAHWVIIFFMTKSKFSSFFFECLNPSLIVNIS